MQLVTNMRLNKMEKQKEIDFQRLDWIKAKKERHRIITINYERQEIREVLATRLGLQVAEICNNQLELMKQQ